MLTLLSNAEIRTMHPAMPRADAAVIDGERFAFVGTEAAARAWLAGRPYEALRLDGETVIPGFNDSHMHYLHTALGSTRVQLAEARSIQDVLDRLRAAQKAGAGPWIVADGWNQERFAQKRLLTRQDLDQVSADVPILASRACGHIAAANSRALAIAGVDFPDGILREDEISLVARHISPPEEAACLRAMVEAQHGLFARGITSVQSDDVSDMENAERASLLRGICGASDAGTLKVRYAAQAHIGDVDMLEDFCRQGLHRLRGKGFRVSCIKLMADGSLGARTALLRGSYADAPAERGIALHPQAELGAIVRTATRHGMPTAIHAIGDGAMQQVLDAFAAEGGGLRHAVVHAQISDWDQVARCGVMGLTIMAQPIFLDADIPIVQARVGNVLAESSYRWRTMLALGAHVAFGTDCPVEPYDPMPNLYCAAARTGLDEKSAYLPEEGFTLDEALFAYTAAGAYASGEEAEKGCIAPGMLADFVVLDGRLVDGEPACLLRTSVRQTYIGGACVYQK